MDRPLPRSPSPSRRIDLTQYVGLATAILCGIIIFSVRLKFMSGNFGNYDVAGIVYNAEVIQDGGLPYVDTFEIKSPLTFYLFAAVFELTGTSLIHVRILWGIWHLLSCVVLFLTGARLSGRLSGSAAAIILALCASLEDINYTSWLVLPLTLAIYFLVRAQERERIYWYFAAGAMAAAAFLTKKNGGFVCLVALPQILRPLVSGRDLAGLKATLVRGTALALGGVACLLPFIVYYAARGHVGALLQGLFPGWVLSGVLLARSDNETSYLVFSNLHRGLWQLLSLYRLPAFLAGVTVVSMVFKRSFFGYHGLLSLSWFVVSFFSVAVTGGRFYGHHTVLYVPSLVMLGTNPAVWSWLLRRARDLIPWSLLRWSLYAAFGLATTYGAGWAVHAMIVDKRINYDVPFTVGSAQEQKYIGEFIRRRTSKDDTIIAWGWQAWPIYHWADRRAPSPVYKEMAVLTDVSTNTSWSASRIMHFAPGPIADEYIAAVKRKRPAYVVISKWYPLVTASNVEPLLEFDELYEYLKEGYNIHGLSHNFLVLERNDISKKYRDRQPPDEKTDGEP